MPRVPAIDRKYLVEEAMGLLETGSLLEKVVAMRLLDWAEELESC